MKVLLLSVLIISYCSDSTNKILYYKVKQSLFDKLYQVANKKKVFKIVIDKSISKKQLDELITYLINKYDKSGNVIIYIYRYDCNIFKKKWNYYVFDKKMNSTYEETTIFNKKLNNLLIAVVYTNYDGKDVVKYFIDS